MFEQLPLIFTLDAVPEDGGATRLDHTAIAVSIVAACSLVAFVTIPVCLFMRWL